MTLGTGLFAATFLVVLYLAVRQVTVSRRWRLVGKIIGMVLIAIVGVGVAVWQWNKYQNRPRPVDELGGVRLGMSVIDVKLAKGVPTTGGDDKPDESSSGNFSLSWVYGDDPSMLVAFAGKSANGLNVSFVCETGGYSTRLGLGRFSTEGEIRDALGSPTKISIKKDGLSKTLSFSQWHLAFEFEKGSVTMLCVTDHNLTYTEELAR